MHPIRRVRLAHNLTITELALRSGVSARKLGAAELGVEPLQRADLEKIANALQIPIAQIIIARNQPALWHWRSFGAAFICCMILGLVGLFGMPFVTAGEQPPPVQAAVLEFASPTLIASPTAILLVVTQAPLPTLLPTPKTVPLAAKLADPIPRACPLLAESERILITQGYAEGTHAPANIAGAIDLGIDSDNDENADPDATQGVVVLATHTGIVRIFPDTWPGGNIVRVLDDTSGWNTLYAHLASFAVADGQQVEVGQPIGTVGSTGLSSGPHLHYEIWLHSENRDPMEFVICGR
jgi:Peptidase family M23/Helix-turn-helix